MSGVLEVAACVASIISAFGTGLEFVRSIKAKRRARKLKRANPPIENELQIQHSLESGPLEIQAEYDRYFTRMGERFAAGDTHTLLALNSGILQMQMLSASLTTDALVPHHASNSLLTLSNASKINTLQALGQLHQRLMESSVALLHTPRGHDGCTCWEDGERRRRHHNARESKSRTQVQDKQRREKELGGRGGHGRSKSASTEKVELAWVRSKKRPSLSSTKSSTSTRSNSMDTTSSSTMTKSTKATSRPSTEPRSSNTSQKDSKQAAATTRPPQPVASELLDRTSLLPQFPIFDPAHNSPASRRMDRVTPSIYSFRSDSTKLGEIPQHKWLAPPPIQNQLTERYRPPVLPLPIPPPLEETKEKSGLGKRLFRNFLKPSATNAVMA